MPKTATGIFIQGHDVTDDRRNEALRTAHDKVLELAIGDCPLENTLSELIRIVESTSSTGVLGSILLLDPDGKHLRHGAAPSLPRAYTARRSTARDRRLRGLVRDRGLSRRGGLRLRHRDRSAVGRL